jgi:hypothetical protein
LAFGTPRSSLVEISVAVAADLARLSDALEDPGVDLELLLRQLSDSCSLAVDSYLGFSITVVIDDRPFAFTVLEDFLDPSEITASAMLPLAALGGFSVGSEIIFYAANPGAFVDLVADLNFALKLETSVAELDQHLVPPDQPVGVTGLAEMSVRNVAIGVLIDRGHLPEQVGAELDRVAELEGLTRGQAAQWVVDTAARDQR